jgi:hypothetical protein
MYLFNEYRHFSIMNNFLYVSHKDSKFSYFRLNPLYMQTLNYDPQSNFLVITALLSYGDCSFDLFENSVRACSL